MVAANNLLITGRAGGALAAAEQQLAGPARVAKGQANSCSLFFLEESWLQLYLEKLLRNLVGSDEFRIGSEVEGVSISEAAGKAGVIEKRTTERSWQGVHSSDCIDILNIATDITYNQDATSVRNLAILL